MGLLRLLHRFMVRQTMPSAAVSYYEKMSAGVLKLYLKPFSEEVNEAFRQGIRILDVGTGTGHLPVLLTQANRRHHVTGLDLSRACIRSAQARANQAGVSERVRWVCGEVGELRDTFDLVVSTCSLHHWRYPGRMLRSMARRLNEGGQIWLLDDSGDASGSARSAWVRKVEASFDAGILFRTVFNFESRWLAYTEAEIRSLCSAAGLRVSDFRLRDVFFLAKCSLTAGQADRATQGQQTPLTVRPPPRP